MNEYKENNLKEIVEKINVLLPFVKVKIARDLVKVKEKIEYDLINDIGINEGEYIKIYDEIEKDLLKELPIKERTIIEEKIFSIRGRYIRQNALLDDKGLFSNYTILNRLEQLEKTINRISERPRIYEKKIEERQQELNSQIKDVDDKFRTIMNIQDKNSSITEQIGKVSQLEDKLQKLETEAQEMLNSISSVQLGKQYFEAKKQYSYYAPKRKFSKKKQWIIRKFFDSWFYITWIFKRVFQKDFFLYLGFISSLLLLAVLYLVLVILEETSFENFFLTVPLLWLAWFFQRKINTREKLYEVYNHKQKVMETYVAFKNSEYTFHAEDKMEDVLLEAIKKDPSDCIGKDNTTLVETILDRLRGLFVSEKVKKTIREEIINDK